MSENKPLTLDEALAARCEHGVPLAIVCPVCSPEKYILSAAETLRLQEEFKEYAE